MGDEPTREELEFERDAALEMARNYRDSLKSAEQRWSDHVRNEHP